MHVKRPQARISVISRIQTEYDLKGERVKFLLNKFYLVMTYKVLLILIPSI